LGSLRLEDYEFEPSVDNIERPILNKKGKEKKMIFKKWEGNKGT
jgi:hypothetical protein